MVAYYFYKRIGLLVGLALILALALTACGDATSTTVPATTAATTAAATTKAATTTAAPTTAAATTATTAQPAGFSVINTKVAATLKTGPGVDQTNKVIKVGTLFPLSGPVGPYGKIQLSGVEA